MSHHPVHPARIGRAISDQFVIWPSFGVFANKRKFWIGRCRSGDVFQVAAMPEGRVISTISVILKEDCKGWATATPLAKKCVVGCVRIVTHEEEPVQRQQCSVNGRSGQQYHRQVPAISGILLAQESRHSNGGFSQKSARYSIPITWSFRTYIKRLMTGR